MKTCSKKILTLCIIHQGDRVLLGMKKRGFGAGRWNGFGGKVEKGETIEEAMRREVFEEASIDVVDAEEVGVLEFEFKFKESKNSKGVSDILETHIFRATQFVGEPKEGEEMKPQWFDVHDIPYKNMWSDDIYWLPLFLQGKKFGGEVLFGANDEVLSYTIVEK
jgi:8-oxo-dGTP diphosphatase / 2-hydroxy-dATP diphosphatase